MGMMRGTTGPNFNREAWELICDDIREAGITLNSEVKTGRDRSETYHAICSGERTRPVFMRYKPSTGVVCLGSEELSTFMGRQLELQEPYITVFDIPNVEGDADLFMLQTMDFYDMIYQHPKYDRFSENAKLLDRVIHIIQTYSNFMKKSRIIYKSIYEAQYEVFKILSEDHIEWRDVLIEPRRLAFYVPDCFEHGHLALMDYGSGKLGTYVQMPTGFHSSIYQEEPFEARMRTWSTLRRWQKAVNQMLKQKHLDIRRG